MSRRRWTWGAYAALFVCFTEGCTSEVGPPAGDGSGSNTNWLRGCETDSQCGGTLHCACGICQQLCRKSKDCAALPEAECVPLHNHLASADCRTRTSAGEAPDESVCLSACQDDRDCESFSFCSAEHCVPSRSPPCPRGTALRWVSEDTATHAREGGIYAEELYLPAELGEGSTPPSISERTFTLQAVNENGEAIEACAIDWVPSPDGGWAFPLSLVTDQEGIARAIWVAGPASEAELKAVAYDADGRAITASTKGDSKAHDEAPLYPGEERALSVAPTTIWTGFSLPPDTRSIVSKLEPKTFPHHAFYSMISASEFFMGLQNTSDFDYPAAEISPANRIWLASVWNTETESASLIFQADSLTCEPHTQGLGGQSCRLQDAWQTLASTSYRTSFFPLAPEESPAYEADLGLDPVPCGSPDGCLDFLVSRLDEAEEPLVVLRHPNRKEASYLYSFIQAYAKAESQTSCLLTPRYEIYLEHQIETETETQALSSAEVTVSTDYASNQVCANYGAAFSGAGLQLITGGERAIVRPLLQTETHYRIAPDSSR